MTVLDDWSRVGERVRAARIAKGRSQAELAAALGLDRTAIGRVESGDRRLSLIEAAQLADSLDVDLPLLLTEPPLVVTSHRQPPADESAFEQRRARAALLLEQHALDTAWLVTHRYLDVGKEFADATARISQSEAAGSVHTARRARERAGLTAQEPIGELAAFAEGLGIYLLTVDEEIEGASLDVGDWAVAVIGGSAEPGRRRMTAAHEIGHQVLGDAYSVDLAVHASTDERERVIDRFAAELLLPAAVVSERLAGVEGSEQSDTLLRLAAEYRVSWRAAVRRAVDAEVIPGSRQEALRRWAPTRGDLVRVVGREVPPDLEPGSTGPRWTKAVLDAYAAGELGARRALQLLGGRFSEDQLPATGDDDLW